MNPLKKIIGWYFTKNALPYWCLFLLDSIIVFVSAMLTYWVFNRTGVMFKERFEVLYSSLAYTVISVLGARLFRTYAGVIRYSSFVDLIRVAYANILSLVIAILLTEVAKRLGIAALLAFDLTQTFIIFILAMLLMCSLRVLVKTLYEASVLDNQAIRVLIYGTMSGGIGIAKYINSQSPRRYMLRGFITHDPKWNHVQLMGEKVYSMQDDLTSIIKKEHIQGILISPLRVDDFRINQDMQDKLIEAGCKIYMAQQVKEAIIEDGKVSDTNIDEMKLKEVSVEDLLPRGEIHVDLKSVEKMLKGKKVLITGSAGSIGSEIVRQVAQFKPAAMMLIDQAETPEHDIRLMMANEFPTIQAETVVTSICREKHMEYIFREFRPDYVFHAAAYKHVPMMENNPSEAVLNNVRGTKIVADLCVKYGVKKFVMISTDKAVNPTNVMGCSKRICEIYVQSLNSNLKKIVEEKLKDNTDYVKHTEFVTTRFGNVLGSNGSVIPLFREQIKNGGPVTVTDERIVRYFMLIPEACKLVLEAGTKGKGGEIFVFDMGQPVKIANLAKRMIALSGAKNVEIKYTGLRAGEKLYEEVLNELENTKPSFHDKIRIAEVREYDYEQVNKEIEDLIAISLKYDNMATVKKMKEIVPEYKSSNSIYEQLDVSGRK